MTYLCGRIDGGASGHMGTHIPGDGSKGVVAQAFKLIYLVGLLSAGLIEIPNPAKALEIPQVISFSGIVNDSKGEPLQTGPYTFSFRIYDHPTHPPCKQNDQSDCARLIWGPQVFDGETSMGHFDKVEVYDGSYNILLGPYDISGMPIAQAFATSDRYVEVTIEDDEPSNPRIQFISTPFAFSAFRAFGSTPVGGITMFFGEVDDLPENWKICNGQVVDDPDSPFHMEKLPDLRGLFVRAATSQTDFGKLYGRDLRDPHYHRVDGHIIMPTINTMASVPIKITEERSNLVVQVLRAESRGHSHKNDFSTTTSLDEQTDFDNRPRHINLHFIIRIR